MNTITVFITTLLTAVILLWAMSRIRMLSGSSGKALVYAVFLGALGLRFFLAWNTAEFSSTISSFYSWSVQIYENGLFSFYSSGSLAEYPPAAALLFYVTGALLSFFHAAYLSGPCLLLLKLPSLLCDAAAGILLYRAACRTLSGKQALLLSALYLFHPAILLTSAVWGQNDAVFTLMVILMCIFLTRGQMLPACISFAAGILFHPRAVMFAPLLLYGFLEHVILHDFSWRKLFYHLSQGACVLFCTLLACTPFGLDQVFSQYTDASAAYPYAAVNACNLWGLFGLNWIPQDKHFLFFSYEQWGLLFLILTVSASVLLFLRMRKHPARYFLTGAFLMCFVFLCSVRMHERYLFPALLLLLFAYAQKPAGPLLYCYTGFSCILFCNTAYVLYAYDASAYNRLEPLIVLASAFMLLCAGFFCRVLLRYERLAPFPAPVLFSESGLPAADSSRKKQGNPASSSGRFLRRPMHSQTLPVFTRTDLLLMLSITLIYAVIALYDLGDHDVPQSSYHLTQRDTLTLTFDDRTSCDRMYWYLGNYPDCRFLMETRKNGETVWQSEGEASEFSAGSVFRWNTRSLPEGTEALRLTCLSDEAVLMELSFTDRDGQTVMPINAPDYTLLFDESSLRPDLISFRSGTYFDEIYYTRTAYEYLNGLETYETTHPPLGKCLIALGIRLFGLNPFGWRIMGALFGILMLPFLYLMGRSITKDRLLAALSCLLLAFDFMHFTQTRIATIDVFVTFFIILMYYFMYRYCQMSFYDTPLSKTLLPLGFSGIAMGLGVACKWTGIYAGAGLAVLFFSALFRRYQEYRYAKADSCGTTDGIPHAEIIRRFAPYTRRTILFCIGFFVLLPACIYLLSYLPFRSGDAGLFERMLANQQNMLGYHSSLNATHYYSSAWYEWPLMIRPIFYYSGIVSDTLRQGISAFGNPLIWWAGIPAFFYTLYLAVRKREGTAAFLCIGYLAQYLPWMLVPRLTFIYHYFPSVPFVVLMLVYCAADRKQHMSPERFRILIGLYAACVVGLFCLFYPVLSGQTVSLSFVEHVLRWMDSWVLVL